MVGFEKEQAIRDGAYFKWEQAGRPITDGVEFWLQAEHEFSTSGLNSEWDAAEGTCYTPTCCAASSTVDSVADLVPSESPRLQPVILGEANQSQAFDNGLDDSTAELTNLDAAMDSRRDETPEEFQQDSRSSRRSRRRTG